VKVVLLTGGKGLPYARGLIHALRARGVSLAVVADEELASCDEVRARNVQLHELIGRPDPREGALAKARRVLRYYVRLLGSAVRTDARPQALVGLVMVPFLITTLGQEGYGLVTLLAVLVSMSYQGDLRLRSVFARRLAWQVPLTVGSSPVGMTSR
jgi:hypothetical protein